MDKIRLLYSQTGRGAWISHLDMMRMLQRTMNRADIPVRYSEGFNPHALISILLPLSVGTESVCQLADIRVREEQDLSALPEKMTAMAPEGFHFMRAYENGAKVTELKWMAFSGKLTYKDHDFSAKRVDALQSLFSRNELIVQRKTKRGEAPFDLIPYLKSVKVEDAPYGVFVSGFCSVFEPVVNPELLVKAVQENIPDCLPVYSSFRREKFYREDMQEFE